VGFRSVVVLFPGIRGLQVVEREPVVYADLGFQWYVLLAVPGVDIAAFRREFNSCWLLVLSFNSSCFACSCCVSSRIVRACSAMRCDRSSLCLIEDDWS
jgi:hypothetical protein